jgi:electron transfer flavoprotein beta subunit
MKIAVLVKQVPSTDNVKIDEETGTMIRSELESEMNPLDMYAVEEAVRIKERDSETRITVISMGPLSAEYAIKEAISMGCDEGVLLTDRKYAGADTLATAYTLSQFLKEKEFDLIFAGERATDGETGQVGPMVATLLEIPVLTYVNKITEITRENVTVQRAIEGGNEIIRTTLPALITVVKEINEPRLPNLENKLRAKKSKIHIINNEELKIEEDKIGLKGSPTRVVKVFYPKISRQGEKITTKTPQEAIEKIINFIKEKGVIS